MGNNKAAPKIKEVIIVNPLDSEDNFGEEEKGARSDRCGAFSSPAGVFVA